MMREQQASDREEGICLEVAIAPAILRQPA